MASMKQSFLQQDNQASSSADYAPFETTNTTKSLTDNKLNFKYNDEQDEMLLDDSSEAISLQHIENDNAIQSRPVATSSAPNSQSLSISPATPIMYPPSSAVSGGHKNEELLKQMRERADSFQEKYITYKNMYENQEQIIINMKKQIKHDRTQYEVYRASVKAKLESFMKIKDIEVARLNQLLESKSNHIKELEQALTKRTNPSGITIEVVEDGQIADMETLKKLANQQQSALKATSVKLQKQNQLLEVVCMENLQMKEHIKELQHTIRRLEGQKRLAEESEKATVQKNQRMREILDKGESEIRRIGALVMRLSRDKGKGEGRNQLLRVLESGLL